MRVLFFLPSLFAYRDRARTILEAGKQMDKFVLMVGKKDANIEAEEPSRIVEVGFRKGNRIWNIGKSSLMAAKIIRREKIDVAHDAFGNLAGLFPFKRIFRAVRFVTSFYTTSPNWIQGRLLNDMPTQVNRKIALSMWYQRKMENVMTALSDKVVLQAPGLAGRMIEFNPSVGEKIAIITNSVDSGYWKPSDEGLARRSAAGEEIKIIFAGSIGPARGSRMLVETISLLKKDGVLASLTFAGPYFDYWRADAEKLADELGVNEKVKFIGAIPREALLEEFNRSDVFVYHTQMDGSPRSVLEAMSSGIPIIASRHPGVDVLDPYEEAISFTEFGDAAAVAALLKSFRLDRRPFLERAATGRRIVENRLSIGAVANQYVAFYKGLMEEKGR